MVYGEKIELDDVCYDETIYEAKYSNWVYARLNQYYVKILLYNGDVTGYLEIYPKGQEPIDRIIYDRQIPFETTDATDAIKKCAMAIETAIRSIERDNN